MVLTPLQQAELRGSPSMKYSNIYELVRFYSTEHGTFGAILQNGKPLCVTLENAETRQSGVPYTCLTAGVYTLASYQSRWRIAGYVLETPVGIDTGNTAQDANGGILVGREYYVIDGVPAIKGSAYMLNFLRKILPETFDLEIRWS